MKVLVKHIECGGFGSIIDCDSPRIFCPFCKNRVISFTESKNITPMELYKLIDRNEYIIITLQERFTTSTKDNNPYKD